MGFALSLVTIGILSTSTLSILNDNYSSPNNTPSDSSTQLYSNGMEAGYGATPFKMDRLRSYYVGADGYLYGTGFNSTGELGLGNTTHQGSFVKVGTSTTGGMTSSGFYQPIDYASNGSVGHTAVVDNDGKVWTSGYNGYGQLGNGTTTYRSYFAPVSTGTGTYDLPANYSAVAVAVGGNGSSTSLILTDDGYLYGAGRQYSIGIGTTSTAQTTFTRLDGRVSGLPVAGGASGDIVDFASGLDYSFVLYENGDLYRCYQSNSYILVAKNVTMFDCSGYINGSSDYVYIYNGSTIYTRLSSSATVATSSSPQNGWTSLVNSSDVVQVRGSGSGGGWGYLTSNGNLYLSNSSTSTAPTNSNSTATGTTFYQISDVAYFDIGNTAPSDMSYGVLFNDGTTKFWGQQRYGQLGNGYSSSTSSNLTYANAFTPTVGGGVNSDYGNLPQVQTGLQSTPPATKIFFKKMHFFRIK